MVHRLLRKKRCPGWRTKDNYQKHRGPYFMRDKNDNIIIHLNELVRSELDAQVSRLKLVYWLWTFRSKPFLIVVQDENVELMGSSFLEEKKFGFWFVVSRPTNLLLLGFKPSFAAPRLVCGRWLLRKTDWITVITRRTIAISRQPGQDGPNACLRASFSKLARVAYCEAR